MMASTGASFGVLSTGIPITRFEPPGTNVTGANELRPRRGERRHEIECATELCLCCPGAPSLRSRHFGRTLGRRGPCAEVCSPRNSTGICGVSTTFQVHRIAVIR
jgi:hypothetical protein